MGLASCPISTKMAAYQLETDQSLPGHQLCGRTGVKPMIELRPFRETRQVGPGESRPTSTSDSPTTRNTTRVLLGCAMRVETKTGIAAGNRRPGTSPSRHGTRDLCHQGAPITHQDHWATSRTEAAGSSDECGRRHPAQPSTTSEEAETRALPDLDLTQQAGVCRERWETVEFPPKAATEKMGGDGVGRGRRGDTALCDGAMFAAS